MPSLHILLLDLDDVLIQQVAYHQSLKDCVAMVGRWCGIRAALTDEDISVFESLGVTSEWDSAAICAALLLERAWEDDPSRRLPDSPDAPDGRPLEAGIPDFQGHFRSVIHPGLSGPEGRAATEQRLSAARTHTEQQLKALRDLLRQAYDPMRSLTARIIQELNLGPAGFLAAYGAPAALRGSGYLATLDSPLISAQTAARLASWATEPGKRAVVFTNRPSMMPRGAGGTPEAEIGLERIGLSSLPFISMGHMDWLAAERGLEEQSLLKPSPVHVLAALQRAAGGGLVDSLEAAARLALDQVDDGGWTMLHGTHATVFEDSFRGLKSARAAQAALERIGVQITLDLRGVMTLPAKARALEEAGGTVYPDFQRAAQGVVDGVG
jgi:hypothetical protein